MILEFHDAEIGNTLYGVCRNIDYVYQAEQHTIDVFAKDGQAPVVLCVLFSDTGEPLMAWERDGSNPRAIDVPAGTVINPKSLRPRTDR